MASARAEELAAVVPVDRGCAAVCGRVIHMFEK
jgi:hypothetical protein